MEADMNATVSHRDAVTTLDAAQRALAAGDLATAERICAGVLAAAPQDGKAWTLLTETALQRNRPDAAIVCAERAVALSPNDPIAHILRAKCLFFAGEAGPAVAAAEAAACTIGAAPDALAALGAFLGLIGDPARGA
jgi:predicted Zn-dependent protease